LAQSKDPVLKINSAVKYEQITLCIIALADQDPGLVLDTIDRLPEAKSQSSLKSLAFQMESNDEFTALFLAFRDRFHSRPELMKAGLASLFQRFQNAREAPAESRQRADSLEMTDTEKLLVFESLARRN
jgi:hypothetical protein